MKNMTLKERIEHIWAYYKTPIFITIAVIFILYQACMAIYRGSQETMLYGAFVNQPQVSAENGTALAESFCNEQGYDNRSQIVMFDTGMDLSDSSMSDASLIRLQALVGTDTLDIIIADASFGEMYWNQEVFVNPQEALGENASDVLDPETFYYIKNEEGQSLPIGIILPENISSKISGLSAPSYLYLCSLDKNTDVVLDFITYLFNS